MATFSPENQAPPSYPYFWQQRTQEPRPNEAGAIWAKEGSEAIHGGTAFVNAAYEKGIQNDIYSQVDPIRDEYMASLHVADQSLRSGQQTVDPTGNHPDDVKKLPGTLDTLGSARANGKLSQTDYDARLNSLAKDIRAKYPGYREYVDQAFQRATGRDSANQYIRSVIGDINSFEAARADKKNKIEDMALSRGVKYDGGAGWYRMLKQSGDDPAVQDKFLKWLNGQESYDTDMERGLKKAEMLDKVNKLGTQEHKDATNDTLSSTGPSYWSHNWDFMFATTGMDNPKWQQGINDVRAGKNPNLSSQDAAAIGAHMDLERASWVSRRSRDLAPLLTDPDELSKRVENEAKLYFDPVANAFKDEKWGLAVSQKQIIEARELDKYGAVLSDKEIAPSMLLTAAMHKMNPAMGAFVSQEQANLAPIIAGRYGVDATKLTIKPQQGGESPKEVAERAKAKNIDAGQYYKNQINLLAKIGDKEMSKTGHDYTDALIENTFSDRNKDFIAMFDKDKTVVDEFGKKQFIPGQDWVFQTLTGQGIVDHVWERSHGKNAEHPEYWDNMKGWAENDARYVFKRSENTEDPAHQDIRLQTAEGIGAAEYGTRSYEKPAIEPNWPDLHYNPQNNRFRSSAGPADSKYSSFNTNVDRLNKNLAGLTNIWKKEGLDPTVASYVFLKSFNAQPDSLIDKMIKSMEASQ